MKSLLNTEDWARKEHFLFFKQFEEPFFGVCVDIDCTNAYALCKKEGISFFLFYLHKSLVAANSVEPFRYRISDEEVYVYDRVNASPTINRPDGTFGFSYIDYDVDFQKFYADAKNEIEKVKNGKGLIPAISSENVIHYSSIPWIKFTSLSHARSFSFKDSCPKISFGKMTDFSNRKVMPVSVHVNHALMDGISVGLFVDEFQNLMNNGI